MRTIIAGSRGVGSVSLVAEAVAAAGWTPSVVVSGAARGADKAGEEWAEANGIPVDPYPADWDEHGEAAGFLRNAEMARNADALIALWDGESEGTRHMIECAKAQGLRVYIHKCETRVQRMLRLYKERKARRKNPGSDC